MFKVTLTEHHLKGDASDIQDCPGARVLEEIRQTEFDNDPEYWEGEIWWITYSGFISQMGKPLKKLSSYIGGMPVQMTDLSPSDIGKEVEMYPFGATPATK